MAKLSKILSDFGLSSKERAVFMSLIKLGLSTASSISRDSGVTRTLVYDIMDNLKSLGIISESEEGKIKKYEAVDHAGLVAAIARKKANLAKLEEEAQKAASEFASLEQGREQKTRTKFFTGKEGVENVYDLAINDIKKQGGGTVYTIFSPNKLESLIPGWSDREDYFDIPQVDMRHIMTNSPATDKYIEQMQKYQNHQHKLWAENGEKFPTDTLCWDDKIAYIDLNDYPSGVIVENKAVADTFRMWFEKMWGSL